MKISMPKSTFLTIASDVDNALHPLLFIANTLGRDVVVSGSTASLDALTDTDLLTWTIAKGIVAAGGEVEGLPAWFVIADADMSDAVPASIDYSAEDEAALTWDTWGLPNYSKPLIAGNRYIPTNAYGSELAASILAPIESSGITIVDTAGYLAVQPADPV